MVFGLCALTLSGCSPELAKSFHLHRGERYFKAGDYEKAKIEYLRAFQNNPRDPTAIERLGLIWFEEGAPLRAYQYLHTASDMQPENLEVRCKLATILMWFGEYSAAREEAKKILETFAAAGGRAFRFSRNRAAKIRRDGDARIHRPSG